MFPGEATSRVCAERLKEKLTNISSNIVFRTGLGLLLILKFSKAAVVVIFSKEWLQDKINILRTGKYPTK
jgi:hypothetical protein